MTPFTNVSSCEDSVIVTVLFQPPFPFNLSLPDMKAVHGVSTIPTLGHFAVAVSSIAMHLDQFLGRENVEQDMANFATEYEYSLIVLMGINTNVKGEA